MLRLLGLLIMLDLDIEFPFELYLVSKNMSWFHRRNSYRSIIVTTIECTLPVPESKLTKILSKCEHNLMFQSVTIVS